MHENLEKVPRNWGYYKILHTDGPGVKLKELTVDPGKCLSMQVHNQRNEFWFISTGCATVYTLNDKEELEKMGTFLEKTHLFISKNQWHQLCNETKEPLRIIEIQYGENCIEEDIVRKDFI